MEDLNDEVDPCAAYVRSYINTIEARVAWDGLSLSEQLHRIASSPKKRARRSPSRLTATKIGGGKTAPFVDSIAAVPAKDNKTERLATVQQAAEQALVELEHKDDAEDGTTTATTTTTATATPPPPPPPPPKKVAFARASWRN